MPYSKQTWADGPTGGTPMSAARLGHIEDGLEAVEIEAAAAAALAGAAIPGSAAGVTIATLDPMTHVLPDNQIPAGIARDTEVASAVAGLVASSPVLLVTLRELADAIADDPNFATTMTNALATKATTAALATEAATARTAEGTRINYRGAWAPFTLYATNDAVSYNSGFYRAPAGFTSGATFVVGSWHEITPQAGTYRARTAKISGLAPTVICFHRGVPGQFPENTAEGNRMAASFGAPMLNLQARMTADGIWVLMHDTTLDRTTNLTGLPVVESLLSAKIAQATISPSKIAAVAGFGFSDGLYRVPTLAQMLDEFAGKYVINIEMKTGGTAAIASMLALLARYDIKDSVIICSFVYANLVALAAAGYSCQWLDANAAPPAGRTLAQMLADGVTYMGWDYTLVSDGTIAAVLAAGVKGFPYVINYRKDRDHSFGLGCMGVVSDDPIYLSGSGGYADAFESKVPFPGMNGSASSAYRGEFFGTNRFGVGLGSATVQEFVALPPIPVPDLTLHTDTVVINLDTAPVTGWSGYLFGAADDSPTNLGSIPPVGAGIYFLKVNVSNTLAAGGVAQVRLYLVDNTGTLFQIGSSVVGSAVIPDGGTVTVALAQSTAGITAPVSGAATGTITSAGANAKLLRGPYTWIGRGGSAATRTSIPNRTYA